MSENIRWHQRFSNYRKALKKFNEAFEVIKSDADARQEKIANDEMLRESLIKRFEYTHELAWNVMKDYAEFQGNTNVGGSRDATRDAFKLGLITEGEAWMDMLKSRNLSTHTYNEDTANEIFNKIVHTYQPLFMAFAEKMESLRSGKRPDIFDEKV